MLRKALIAVCCFGAVTALPLSQLTHAAPAGAASFVEAAMNGNRDAVRALLKDGVDVNTTQADGMTALHWAAQKGDVEHQPSQSRGDRGNEWTGGESAPLTHRVDAPLEATYHRLCDPG